ncbi:adp-ribose glycohydrolase macrod2 [Anaeramoeba flamelloides]|uniref:Adp-ribose glycohydrolase macrod2 n=1 Tax=Anaeramoeba flamelloides TaxID=1746091 RepID=A0AAV7ZCL6_9EUKA|nr:adp-ribose glycohydrolase macrod2 [Anaeramoeba flamelloides]KAJ6244194.1 adp-ribose glycohydrolase macrod2 [Anaeramoeba flamelloides]
MSNQIDEKKLTYISHNVQSIIDGNTSLPSREEKRKKYKCGSNYSREEDIISWTKHLKNLIKEGSEFNEPTDYKVNRKLNDKLSLWRGDSTKLEIESIVNAANSSLLGGGGIDGAIHQAAGDSLFEECIPLLGCHTGETKITLGHNLPAYYILHTVGPVGYKPDELKSCYRSILDLMVKCKIRKIAICGISTGVFGFPLELAVHLALATTREWLLEGDNLDKVDRIIFVTYLQKEQICYSNLMHTYFPSSIQDLIQEINDEINTSDEDSYETETSSDED